ncbi:hypothetical protein Goklo_013181, partial [Gossypium klotzschianum]|nr:hypothetical protein [Gossypium klotzschianum]
MDMVFAWRLLGYLLQINVFAILIVKQQCIVYHLLRLTIYNEIKLCKKGDGNGDESSSRINKKCNVGIGPWSEHRNGCCDRTCAIKYPDVFAIIIFRE